VDLLERPNNGEDVGGYFVHELPFMPFFEPRNEVGAIYPVFVFSHLL
jgi:hypothetical protein